MQLPVFWPSLPLIALWQGVGTLFTIQTTSLRQTLAPNALLGRVMMTANVISGATIPLGTWLGGVAIDATGNIALIFSIIGTAIILLASGFSFTAVGRGDRYLPLENGPPAVGDC